MRFKRKKDLKEQIRELQSIIHIQGSSSPVLRVRPPGWILASSSLGGEGRGGEMLPAGLLQVGLASGLLFMGGGPPRRAWLASACPEQQQPSSLGGSRESPSPSTRLPFQNKGGSSAPKGAKRPCARTGS